MKKPWRLAFRTIEYLLPHPIHPKVNKHITITTVLEVSHVEVQYLDQLEARDLLDPLSSAINVEKPATLQETAFRTKSTKVLETALKEYIPAFPTQLGKSN